MTASDRRRGRIRPEDIAAVREKARIDEVIGDHVTLKSGGVGSLKGLCPFHDERTPSFTVSPAKGMFHCFGCGEGGDVIDFVREIEHLDFVEAVQRLADRYDVPLVIETDPEEEARRSKRTRLAYANKLAAEFFTAQLGSPEAVIARQFLGDRGFGSGTVAQFEIGYSPKDWSALTKHLRGKGFKDEELLEAGLVVEGQRGVYDRFRGRLMWPIRDLSGDVVGFGARKLHSDDEGPKYLNTPETPLYRKSQVLYGIDRARRDISKTQTAVIVEGYTDVMACHLAGVTTAIATCGTAFGPDHIRVLRRLLLDSADSQVVFTFDGDAAGQKAALRAFGEDQRFFAQTFAAVDPDGMDPCDLRLQGGDEAIMDLIGAKVPLFQFAIKSIIEHHDVSTAEGRARAVEDIVPIVASIKDAALRPEYARLAAGWIGVDVDTVVIAVARSGRRNRDEDAPQAGTPASDPALIIQREALKCVLQHPLECADWYESVEESAYTHSTALAVHRAVIAAGGPGSDVAEAGGAEWIDAVVDAAGDDDPDTVRQIHALAVEPLPLGGDGDATKFSVGVLARLLEMDAARRIDDLKSQMRQAGDDVDTSEMFKDLLALEDYRRSLKGALSGEQ